MQLKQLDSNKKCFHWDMEHTHVEPHQLQFENREHMVNLFNPYVTVDMKQFSQINEVTYKEIAQLIDGNFLKQKIRADALTGIQLHGFDGDMMNFLINSSEFDRNRIRYMNTIKFDQWAELGQDPDFNFAERARMLLWVGDIRLHCTCPSFLYWGYQYILSVLDAAVYPEARFPKIRNPGERGVVCKHMNRILRVLPFYSGVIARELKKQFGGP